jgi:hypothetical protein
MDSMDRKARWAKDRREALADFERKYAARRREERNDLRWMIAHCVLLTLAVGGMLIKLAQDLNQENMIFGEQSMAEKIEPFQFAPHAGDVGHSMMISTTGSGKTVSAELVKLWSAGHPGGNTSDAQNGNNDRK